MTFITLVLIFIALFINHDFAVVILFVGIILSAWRICIAGKERKDDPMEFKKVLILNTIEIAICAGLLLWAHQ